MALHAESTNTSLRFAGVPADGGQNCSTCHTGTGGANADARGMVTINAADYNPGIGQMLHITITHPTASRWGFQLTARPVSDETKQAGTFLPLSPAVQVRCDDGSRFGSPSPCNGAREFAEHLLAPQTPAGQGFTFDVQWTPPANEVGDVRLYLSAVAADNDGTAAGDRVYTLVKTVSAVGACTLTAKPTLLTAVNAASFMPAFSSNSLITIKGLGFQVPGRSRVVGAGDISNNQFPLQLACVAVEINGQRVPILYVQQDQINAQAPALSGSGPVTIVVILNPGKINELRSDQGTLTSQQIVAPAFFVNGSAISAQFANTTTQVGDPAAFPGFVPAKAGDILTLYGTGFGATTPQVASGQIASDIARVTTPITVSIGGIAVSAADVLYAGLSPGSISGLYQINVRVPSGVPNGNQPVIVTQGGFQTQTGATILIQN